MLFILSLIAGLLIGSIFLGIVILMDRSFKSPTIVVDDLQDPAPSFGLTSPLTAAG